MLIVSVCHCICSTSIWLKCMCKFCILRPQCHIFQTPSPWVYSVWLWRQLPTNLENELYAKWNHNNILEESFYFNNINLYLQTVHTEHVNFWLWTSNTQTPNSERTFTKICVHYVFIPKISNRYTFTARKV